MAAWWQQVNTKDSFGGEQDVTTLAPAPAKDKGQARALLSYAACALAACALNHSQQCSCVARYSKSPSISKVYSLAAVVVAQHNVLARQ